jgi:hypothetical protein
MSKLEVVKELRKKTVKQDYINPALLNDDRETFFVNVLIRGKKFRQYCGDGHQKIRWLTDCAIFKYENGGNKKKNCGIAYGLKNENGDLCDLENTIASCLTNGANVLVLLKEEYDAELRERERQRLSNKKKTTRKLDLNGELINNLKPMNGEENEINDENAENNEESDNEMGEENENEHENIHDGENNIEEEEYYANPNRDDSLNYD